MAPKANAASKGAPEYLMVSGVTDDKVRNLIRGHYRKSDQASAGKPVYKRQVISAQRGQKEVVIYFCDESDGPEFCGWWFGLEVGGDDTIAFSPNKKSSFPPTDGWKVPYDGPVDRAFKVVKTEPPKEEPKPQPKPKPKPVEPPPKIQKTEPVKEPEKAKMNPVKDTKVTTLLLGQDESSSSEDEAPKKKEEQDLGTGLADILKAKGWEKPKEKLDKTEKEKLKKDATPVVDDTWKYNGIWIQKDKNKIVAEIKDGKLTWAPSISEVISASPEVPVPARPPLQLTFLGGMIAFNFRNEVINGKIVGEELKWSDGDKWMRGPSGTTLEAALEQQAINEGLIQVEETSSEEEEESSEEIEEKQANETMPAEAAELKMDMVEDSEDEDEQRMERIRKAQEARKEMKENIEQTRKELEKQDKIKGPKPAGQPVLLATNYDKVETATPQTVILDDDEDDPYQHLYDDPEKLQDVEELLRRALKAMHEKLGPTHPNTLDTVYNLCAVLNALSKEEEGEKILNREITGFEDVEDEKSDSDEDNDAENNANADEEKPLLASTLWKEDVWEAGHRQVWGSLYDKESDAWGYACCGVFERFAACKKVVAEQGDGEYAQVDFVDFDAPLEEKQAGKKK